MSTLAPRLRARTFAALLGLVVLALAGCGTQEAPKKEEQQEAGDRGGKQEGGADPEQARREYISALEKWRSGVKRYASRMEEDAEARNISGIEADVRGWRDTFYEFDGSLRRIQMPAQVRPDLNRVLEMDRTLIGDFDAFGAAGSRPEQRRLLGRMQEDIESAKTVIVRLAEALDRANR
jgi:hypothetical protein